MFNFKVVAVAAIAAGAATFGTANAAVLTGTFNIGVYNYNAGGSSAAADATAANVAAHNVAGEFLGNFTYTGDLNFITTGGGGSSILEFLQSAGGALSSTTGLNTLISAGGFGTTTLLDITANLGALANGVISHDDGISLFQNGVLIVDSAAPTVDINTPFTFAGGAFRLIYSAANGNPEVLRVDASPVPLPGALLLFMGGLGGLGAVTRRRLAA